MFFRACKREFYKTVMHRPTWALFVCSVLVALIINSTGAIYSATKLKRLYGEQPVSVAATALGLEGNVTSDNIIELALEKQFFAVFRHTASGIAWISIVFAAYFVCNEYHERGFDALLSHGVSKRTIFWAKWISCMAAFWLAATIILLIMMLRYTVLSKQSMDLIARDLLLYSLMIFAYGSQCIFIAFLCRNMLWTAGITFVMLLLQNISPILHPLQIMQYENLWKMDAPESLTKMALTNSFALLLICTIAARICFQKMELKREV